MRNVLGTKFVVWVKFFFVFLSKVNEFFEILLRKNGLDGVNWYQFSAIKLWTFYKVSIGSKALFEVAFHAIQTKGMLAFLLAVLISSIVADIAKDGSVPNHIRYFMVCWFLLFLRRIYISRWHFILSLFFHDVWSSADESGEGRPLSY